MPITVDGLTHINYAFAYIDPSSFEITTMDAQTPAKTFQDVVDLKGIKPSLRIYVSIGGASLDLRTPTAVTCV